MVQKARKTERFFGEMPAKMRNGKVHLAKKGDMLYNDILETGRIFCKVCLKFRHLSDYLLHSVSN